MVQHLFQSKNPHAAPPGHWYTHLDVLVPQTPFESEFQMPRNWESLKPEVVTFLVSPKTKDTPQNTMSTPPMDRQNGWYPCCTSGCFHPRTPRPRRTSAPGTDHTQLRFNIHLPSQQDVHLTWLGSHSAQEGPPVQVVSPCPKSMGLPTWLKKCFALLRPE